MSSITLATILYLDNFYGWFYFIAELFIFIYKGYGLYYPPEIIGLEVAGLILFWITFMGRIETGIMGNKTENSGPLSYFVILCLIGGFGYAYFMSL